MKASGSKRGELLKISELPLVRVLFPAPFAPAISVKTGELTVPKLALRSDAVRLPFGPAISPTAGGLQRASLWPLARAFGQIPANSCSWWIVYSRCATFLGPFPSNSCPISALPIVSKSSGTTICPAIKPNRRICRTVGASSAVTLTRGLPALAIMKGSPLAVDRLALTAVSWLPGYSRFLLFFS